jgi:hypothetical protein
VDDHVLERLAKRHTRRDFLDVAAAIREAGLTLHPTFIAFTPWTTLEGYRELLRVLLDLDLVDHVAPVQLALRLLVTHGSLLLDLEEVRGRLGPFDPVSLVYPWTHADPGVDALAAEVFSLVASLQRAGRTRREIFASIWQRAHGEIAPEGVLGSGGVQVPHLDEPWYCCAEPVPAQVPVV